MSSYMYCGILEMKLFMPYESILVRLSTCRIVLGIPRYLKFLCSLQQELYGISPVLWKQPVMQDIVYSECPVN